MGGFRLAYARADTHSTLALVGQLVILMCPSLLRYRWLGWHSLTHFHPTLDRRLDVWTGSDRSQPLRFPNFCSRFASQIHSTKRHTYESSTASALNFKSCHGNDVDVSEFETRKMLSNHLAYRNQVITEQTFLSSLIHTSNGSSTGTLV